ncbi:unnamed protein product [Auanema sp. JU1783]|nr:unnamed protein product [Auanema sp. JU1783]
MSVAPITTTPAHFDYLDTPQSSFCINALRPTPEVSLDIESLPRQKPNIVTFSEEEEHSNGIRKPLSGERPHTSDSFSNFGKRFTKRASQIILEVPVAKLRKLNETEGISSWRRETKHFADNTTLHGPKRVFYGKGRSTIFWAACCLFSITFFIYQVVVLLIMYFNTPTVSQVSFIMNDNGLAFPMTTVCNFNPLKKTYIKELNKTGDFSDVLLDYLMLTNEDVQILYGNVDRAQLQLGDGELNLYQQNHPNFTTEGFYMDAGFECEEIVKICTFGGRQFDCCKYMTPVLTNMGKCYTLNLQDSGQEWLEKQTTSGVNAGLEIILDTHLEEQFDGTEELEAEPIFYSNYENGYRFYVHPINTIPYFSSEGISVSPSVRVYSAIITEKYVLLPSDHWGNCTDHWPLGYDTKLPYTSDNCASLCKAKFFHNKCGCSPFTFNIDNSFPLCTPYQTSICIDKFVRVSVNGTDYYRMPKCSECKMECDRTVYHAFNSYGHGFSNGALKWLSSKNRDWTIPHIKSNFLTINVFFREMGHTEYTQVQATSLTETLSEIGGNMGMFMGMSLITVMEVTLYLSKVSWIIISKKRRDYMYQKKKKEEEKQKQLEETVSQFNQLRTRKASGESFRKTREVIRDLRRKISNSISERTRTLSSSNRKPTNSISSSIDQREADMESQRKNFMNNKRKSSMYEDHRSSEDSSKSVMQFRVNIDDLYRSLHQNNIPINVNEIRRRSNTVPSTPTFYLEQYSPPSERRSNNCPSVEF